jgi:Spy/CpxP family protein refolding chaperone
LGITVSATDDTLAQLDKLINTARGRELFDAMSAARTKFHADRDEVVRLVNGGQYDDAAHTLLAAMRPPSACSSPRSTRWSSSSPPS